MEAKPSAAPQSSRLIPTSTRFKEPAGSGIHHVAHLRLTTGIPMTGPSYCYAGKTHPRLHSLPIRGTDPLGAVFEERLANMTQYIS